MTKLIISILIAGTLFVAGCAENHQREVRIALADVDRILQLKHFEKERLKERGGNGLPLSGMDVLSMPENAEIKNPNNGETVRGYYLRGVAVCRQDDTRCWQHEYIHHLSTTLDKNDVEELLARLVVRHLELEDEADRAKTQVKELKRRR